MEEFTTEELKQAIASLAGALMAMDKFYNGSGIAKMALSINSDVIKAVSKESTQ